MILTHPHEQLERSLSQAKHPLEHTTPLASYYRSCDQEVVESCAAKSIHLGCSQGCSHCCYQRVTVAPHEVFVVTDYIERRFLPDERQKLNSRLDGHLDMVKNLSKEERDNRKVACPFLVNGKCSIYPVRPIVCHGMHSLCSSSCEKHFSNKSGPFKPSASPVLFELWEKMGFLADQSYRRADYDLSEHDFPFAVRSALSNPIHHKRWRQKKMSLLDGKIRDDPHQDIRNMRPNINTK